MDSSPFDDTGVHRPLPAVIAELGEGAHVGVLYADPADRDAHLIPYFSAALRAGDAGLCVTAADADEMTDQVRRGAPGSTADFEVLSSATTYFHDGGFSAPSIRSRLSALAEQAPSGSAAPRFAVAGDLDWLSVLDDDSLSELFDYESALDALAAGCRHTFACFYDLNQLPARSVIDVFRTHRRVLVAGALWDSPFYRAPGRDRADGRMDDSQESTAHHDG